MPGIPGARFAALAGVLAVLLGACGGGASTSPSAPGGGMTAGAAATRVAAAGRVDLTIYAAASLNGVLEKARSAYEATHAGVTLTISTDASSALETKIEQGAPADVFLSADAANPQKLVDAGLADGPVTVFARNELAVIVPADNPAGIRTPADLAKPGVKIIAAGNAVPITEYAAQVVQNLAREPGYPPDFATRYDANVVSKEDNAKAVVAKLELGEGDAGIAYVTDAAASRGVVTIPVPDSANVLATYAGVVVQASRNAAAARELLGWLAGPDGQGVLGGFGFLPPP